MLLRLNLSDPLFAADTIIIVVQIEDIWPHDVNPARVERAITAAASAIVV
jgi:hypothetical protein